MNRRWSGDPKEQIKLLPVTVPITFLSYCAQYLHICYFILLLCHHWSEFTWKSMMQSEHQAPPKLHHFPGEETLLPSLDMDVAVWERWKWTLNFRGKYLNFFFLLTKLFLGGVRGELGEGDKYRVEDKVSAVPDVTLFPIYVCDWKCQD